MTLDTVVTQSLRSIEEASSLEDLEKVRVDTLGKQGVLSLMMKQLGAMEPEERRLRGAEFNLAREEIESLLQQRRSHLARQAMNKRLAEEGVDVTLSPRLAHQGAVHPVSQAQYELIQIFREMGFWVAEGPDIEDDFHNFSALNIPPEHPARQEQDTFYMPKNEAGETIVLRTQTSPVQIRTMQSKQPPIRIVAPGRVYRSDYDQTHTPTFHQIEGLYVDEGVHMGHLKKIIIEFCRRFFERPTLEVRFRPSFFPFTEPSAEVDIACGWKDGQLRIGEGDDWLEVLGCGMVHRKVFQNCGIDADRYTGFAFGLGIERMAMLKYGIPDLRSFYDTDLRWLQHYGFQACQAFMTGGVR